MELQDRFREWKGPWSGRVLLLSEYVLRLHFDSNQEGLAPRCTYPVFDKLFSRLLPGEPGILLGPQRRVILVDALDVALRPSRYLWGG